MDTRSQEFLSQLGVQSPSSEMMQRGLRAIADWIGFNSGRQIKIAKRLTQRLLELEKVPVVLSKRGASTPQAVDYAPIKKVAAMIDAELANHQSFSAVQQRRHLHQLLVALDYRLESVNGGLDPVKTLEVQVLSGLILLAERWKKAQELLEVNELTVQDRLVLADIAMYPRFVELLEHDRDLRDAFFQWTLRDHLSPEVFIQFPGVHQRIVVANLHGRIARVGSSLLRLQKRTRTNDLDEKVVTLPFDGIAISLLDESRIFTFRGHYALSVREVFTIFEEKPRKIGNLEFMAQGVINWNAHLLGWWDAVHQRIHRVNFNRPGWWKSLPIAEVLTIPQAVERYGVSSDGSDWSIAACATRSRRTLAPIGSHAFFEVAVPASGEYHVYSFGKFAYQWSLTAWENLVAFTDNHYATVAYPDENTFFSHRQLARRPITVTPDMGMQMMDAIKVDMVFARENSLIYQWEGENCAKWVQDKLSQTMGSHHLPDLQVPMLHSQPSDASRHLFAVLRYLPGSLHSPVLSLLHYPLGAWRGKWINRDGKQVWVSLTKSQFWEQKLVYLPAMIHSVNENVNSRPFISPQATQSAPAPTVGTLAYSHVTATHK